MALFSVMNIQLVVNKRGEKKGTIQAAMMLMSLGRPVFESAPAVKLHDLPEPWFLLQAYVPLQCV